MTPQPTPSRRSRQESLGRLFLGAALSILALWVTLVSLDGKSLLAQTEACQAAKPVQQRKYATQSRRRVVSKAEPAATQGQDTQEERQLASSPPILPANQPPKPALVSWDRRGLEIEAFNSSLDEILHQVAVDTGAKLEALVSDQRVFGSYGPGPACDVLSKLLDASGYNVLLRGCRDADAPLEIVLSTRAPASLHPAANNQHRSEPDRSEQLKLEPRPENPSSPQHSSQDQNPFDIGGPAHDPSQFMGEILQRQQKIDQQEQQQDQQE